MARDPAQIHPAPEPGPGPTAGSLLYDAARPLVGDHGADKLAVATAALDAVTPEIRRVLGNLMRDPGGSTATGAIPSLPPQRERRKSPAPPRWLTVMLATACFAFVLGGTLTVGVALWSIQTSTSATELRMSKRASEVEARVAHNEGEAQAVRKQSDQRAKDTKAGLAALAAKSDVHDKQIAALTEHMIGRLEAIGKKTGADKLEEWGKVPDDLQLLAVQARLGRKGG